MSEKTLSKMTPEEFLNFVKSEEVQDFVKSINKPIIDSNDPSYRNKDYGNTKPTQQSE